MNLGFEHRWTNKQMNGWTMVVVKGSLQKKCRFFHTFITPPWFRKISDNFLVTENTRLDGAEILQMASDIVVDYVYD